MGALRNNAETEIEHYLAKYESNESHKKRNQTLFSYSVETQVISASMEAVESGGGYMMPGLFQKLVRPLRPRCYTVEYVEDERVGTRADGTTPHKRIDLRIDLQKAEDERLRDCLSNL